MEQMVMLIGMIAFIYFGEKTKVGFYKIIAGLISFGIALTLVKDTFMMVIFIGLALYLISSVFVSKTK